MTYNIFWGHGMYSQSAEADISKILLLKLFGESLPTRIQYLAWYQMGFKKADIVAGEMLHQTETNPACPGTGIDTHVKKFAKIFNLLPLNPHNLILFERILTKRSKDWACSGILMNL